MFKLVILTFLAISGGKAPASDWTLELTVRSTEPSAESVTLTFGWAEGATSGFDSGEAAVVQRPFCYKLLD